MIKAKRKQEKRNYAEGRKRITSRCEQSSVKNTSQAYERIYNWDVDDTESAIKTLRNLVKKNTKNNLIKNH